MSSRICIDANRLQTIINLTMLTYPNDKNQKIDDLMLVSNESALDIITLVYSPGSDEEDQSPTMHIKGQKSPNAT